MSVLCEEEPCEGGETEEQTKTQIISFTPDLFFYHHQHVD